MTVSLAQLVPPTTLVVGSNSIYTPADGVIAARIDRLTLTNPSAAPAEVTIHIGAPSRFNNISIGLTVGAGETKSDDKVTNQVLLAGDELFVTVDLDNTVVVMVSGIEQS